MTHADPDDLLDALAALDRHDLPTDRQQRIRAHALATLAARSHAASHARGRLGRAYRRVVEPALLTALVAIQLLWATHRALLLLR
jgi:hypothetical protein